MTDTAFLMFDNKKMELPRLTGSLGPAVFNISALAKEETFTYDPGFMSRQLVLLKSPISTAIKAYCFIAAILYNSSPKRRIFWKPVTYY